MIGPQSAAPASIGKAMVVKIQHLAVAELTIFTGMYRTLVRIVGASALGHVFTGYLDSLTLI